MPAAAVSALLAAAVAAAPPGPAVDPRVVAEWRIYRVADGPPEAVRALCASGEQVWVGADGVLARVDGDRRRSWTAADGLPLRKLSAVTIDEANGDVWLGTLGDGLVRFSGGRFDRFDQFNSGLAGNLVYAVTSFEGRIWAATNGGISAFAPQADEWELHDARSADVAQRATSCLVPLAGRLVAGGWGYGIRRFDGAAHRGSPFAEGSTENAAAPRVATSPPSTAPGGGDTADPEPRVDECCGASGAILALAAAGDALWAVTPSHLCRCDAGARCASKALPTFESQSCTPTALAVGERGDAWIGTDEGLLMLDDWNSGVWIHYRRDDGGRSRLVLVRDGVDHVSQGVDGAFPDNHVRAVLLRGSAVWIGTARGVAVGERWAAWSSLAHGAEDARSAPESDDVNEPGTTTPRAYPNAGPARTPSAIAVLGPGNRTIALPASAAESDTAASAENHPDLLAVQIAVELARHAAARKETATVNLAPTAPGYAGYGWGLPEDNLVALAERSSVLGIVGALGSTRALMDLAVLRLGVPVLDVAGEADRDNAARNPWVFRCRGGAPRQHRLLLDYVVDRLNLSRLAVLHTGGSSGGAGDWWIDHARARGLPAPFESRVPHDGEAADRLFDDLRRIDPQVILLDGSVPAVTATIARFRRRGCDQVMVVDSPLRDIDLAERVGVDPGMVLAPDASTPPASSAADLAFAEKYAERNRRDGSVRPPDESAFRTFHAADHLLHAAGAAPADRAALRRTLRQMERSAYGERHYEESHPLAGWSVARWEAGRWQTQAVGAP
ncbi:MAG: ABC transporter substrate-binding protein [Planctomycetes bacterium]|nr:ABC transporter substrate-binding protein [Planctomycetota bacterium]